VESSGGLGHDAHAQLPLEKASMGTRTVSLSPGEKEVEASRLRFPGMQQLDDRKVQRR
jgi:hypothetical protein